MTVSGSRLTVVLQTTICQIPKHPPKYIWALSTLVAMLYILAYFLVDC